MTKEIRRSRRYNRFLPVEVRARVRTSDDTISGPYPGRMINLSRHGACLLLSQMSADSFHLFHSTRENDAICLQLKINILPEIINCEIPAQPVWMNIFHEGDIRAFKFGIEFLCDADNDEIKHLEEVVSKR